MCMNTSRWVSDVASCTCWLIVAYDPPPSWVVVSAPGLDGRIVWPLITATLRSETPEATTAPLTHTYEAWAFDGPVRATVLPVPATLPPSTEARAVAPRVEMSDTV